MRIPLIVMLIISLLLTACVQVRVVNPKLIKVKREFEAGKEVEAEGISRVVIIYAQELKKKYKHLILEDSQAFFSDKALSRVQLEFSTQDVIELREARDMLVEVVDELLFRLNNEADVTFASQTELTADQLDIYVDFQAYHGKFVDPMYIGFMSLRKGIVSFYAFDFKECHRDCWHRRLEYYWQSRNIVMFEREAQWAEDQHKKKTSYLDKDRFRISNKESVQGTIQAQPFGLEKTRVPKAALPMGDQSPALSSEPEPEAQEGFRPKKEAPVESTNKEAPSTDQAASTGLIVK
jgi:hypothetical protein